MAATNEDGGVAGRYTICDPIASGGMATVYLGRLRGPAGFSRTVAIKRLHPEFAESPELVAALLDEARLVSRVQHPNVVAPLDVVVETGRLLLVMEYVHGASLAQLLRAGGHRRAVPPAMAAAILVGALRGLHAAHEARGEGDEPLGIVHRDVSPQNILVGVDGLARVADFGVAKARGRLQTTREGQVKGKLAYMAPEQVRLGEVSRRSDIFAAGIVLWEALTGRRLFPGDNEGQVLTNVLGGPIVAPSEHRPGLSTDLDEIVLRALDRDPSGRYETAKDFADTIEQRVDVATTAAVGEWVKERAKAALELRTEQLRAVECAGQARAAVSREDEPTRTATVERPRAGSVSGTENKTYTAPAASVGTSTAGRRSGLGLVAGLALLGTVGLLAYLAGGRGSGMTASTDADARFVTPTSTAPAESVAGTEAAATVVPSSSVAPGSVTIEIVTSPRGAMVEIGTRSYGPTPTEIELPRGDESVALTIRLAGYGPVERGVVPDKAQRLELTLQRAARSQPRTGKPTAAPTATPTATGKEFWRFE